MINNKHRGFFVKTFKYNQQYLLFFFLLQRIVEEARSNYLKKEKKKKIIKIRSMYTVGKNSRKKKEKKFFHSRAQLLDRCFEDTFETGKEKIINTCGITFFREGKGLLRGSKRRLIIIEGSIGRDKVSESSEETGIGECIGSASGWVAWYRQIFLASGSYDRSSS